MKTLICLLFLTLAPTLNGHAAEDPKPALKIYGSEGPAPAMKEVAEAFGAMNSIKVDVTSGINSDKWKSQAQKDADVIYSGSENMMDLYNDTLGILDPTTITTEFLRPAALLVRPGNPKKIKGLKDFLKRDLKIVILNGGGQVAMWEDMIGRMKDVEALRDFRKRIAFSAQNAREALQYWKNHEEVEAWLSFPHWAKDDDVKAEVIPIEKDLVVYRSLGLAVSSTTNQREMALKFVEFLKSAEAEKIFKAQGWFRKN